MQQLQLLTIGKFTSDNGKGCKSHVMLTHLGNNSNNRIFRNKWLNNKSNKKVGVYSSQVGN